MSRPIKPNLQEQFHYYLGGLSTWWVGLGLQSVLITFVVTLELQETPERLGLAQTATMLPSFLLVLFAGVVSDRYDCRKIALNLHIFALLPALFIATGVYFGYLTFELVIIYAAAMSVLSAFNIPSRDALLNRVMIDGEVQRSVSIVTTVQFISQISGFIMAGFASYTGTVPLLIMQAIVMSLGAFFTYWIKPLRHSKMPQLDETKPPVSRLESLREGFRIIGGHPLMRTVSMLNILVGLFFMGSLMVVVPIIIRDVYQGESTKISMVMMAFYAGIIAMSIMLSNSPPVKRIGRDLTIAMLFGAVLMFLVTFEIDFYLFVLIIFAWGATVGFVFTLGRAIVQEFAPATHRARALSIFQFGILGGAPLGSYILGLLSREFGTLHVLYFPAGTLIVTLIIAVFTTGLTKVEIKS